MARERQIDYQQEMLFPPTIEEWVPSDHPARFIRDFVGEIDMKEAGIQEGEGEMGRPRYATKVLLGVWIYGYLEKIRSSRSLEKACREHISLIWLTGNKAPDHNTLWRFWKKNRGVVKKVFCKTVEVAVEAGLVGMSLHAIDGTKILSRGSKRKALHEEELKEILREIEETEKEIEKREKEEKGEYRLPPEWEDSKRRQEEIRKALKRLEKKGKKRELPTDPDARMMKTSRRMKWAYNAQGVVDRESRLIVGEEVTHDENDRYQLIPMLEEVKTNVGSVAKENVADSGYDCTGQYVEAKKRGY